MITTKLERASSFFVVLPTCRFARTQPLYLLGGWAILEGPSVFVFSWLDAAAPTWRLSFCNFDGVSESNANCQNNFGKLYSNKSVHSSCMGSLWWIPWNCGPAVRHQCPLVLVIWQCCRKKESFGMRKVLSFLCLAALVAFSAGVSVRAFSSFAIYTHESLCLWGIHFRVISKVVQEQWRPIFVPLFSWMILSAAYRLVEHRLFPVICAIRIMARPTDVWKYFIFFFQDFQRCRIQLSLGCLQEAVWEGDNFQLNSIDIILSYFDNMAANNPFTCDITTCDLGNRTKRKSSRYDVSILNQKSSYSSVMELSCILIWNVSILHTLCIIC